MWQNDQREPQQIEQRQRYERYVRGQNIPFIDEYERREASDSHLHEVKNALINFHRNNRLTCKWE